jgi:hypothetical protein
MKRALVIVISAALALICAMPAQAAKRKVPHGFYGVMWNRAGTDADPATRDSQFALMAKSGVESVRTVFSWAQAQPTAGEPPSFSYTDSVVALAASHRVSLLPVVIYTPFWARDHPESVSSGPKLPSDYSAYLTALIGRYGPKGTFWTDNPAIPKVPIRTWQIWNEPHFEDYWHTEGGERWPDHYTLLLKDAYRKIKQADPGATVVNTALASFPWKYLKQIYKSGGAKYMDVVAVNPFTVYPWSVIRGERLVRKVMKKAKQGRKPIWITEATWPSSKGKAPGKERASWQHKWETTPKGMAERLRQVFDLVIKRRKAERIGRVYWYTWATKYDGNDLFDYAGLLRWDGTAFAKTRALAAYTASARKHQGCRKTAAGRCR